MALPDDVLTLLAGQHALACRAQLVALGYSPKVVDGWCRRGFLVREHRGVLRQRGAPRTPEQRVMAAVLRGGEGARADGWASCWLHGLEGFTAQVGIVVPFPRQVSSAGFPVRTTYLSPADCTTVRDIPALSAARALIEVSLVVSEKKLRVAIDSARRRGLLTIDWLERRAADLRTLHGARSVLEVIGSKVLEQESEGERFLARFLVGIDGFEWGVDDVVPGRRLDCFHRAALLVFEYDGRDHHVLPTDRDKDGLRDIEVRNTKVDGVRLEIIRITKGMVDADPEGVRAFVRAMIAEREAQVATARTPITVEPASARASR